MSDDRIIRVKRCGECPYVVTDRLTDERRCLAPGHPIRHLASGYLPGSADYRGHDIRAGVHPLCPLEVAQ